MCGIAGWIGKINYNNTSNMLDVLSPRGPDAFGEWIEITNISNSNINLNGLILRDDGEEYHVISNQGRF